MQLYCKTHQPSTISTNDSLAATPIAASARAYCVEIGHAPGFTASVRRCRDTRYARVPTLSCITGARCRLFG
eukprot:scaffold212103_cov21-Tisochrysis_lutea.AAC.1